jgi:hypothetical protein
MDDIHGVIKVSKGNTFITSEMIFATVFDGSVFKAVRFLKSIGALIMAVCNIIC